MCSIHGSFYVIKSRNYTSTKDKTHIYLFYLHKDHLISIVTIEKYFCLL